MKTCTICFGFSLIVLIGGCQKPGGISDDGAAVKKIKTAAQLKDMMTADDVMVVHALPADHYAKAHVPGAANIDYEKMTPEMLPKDKNHKLVFYCTGGMCPVGRRAAEKAAGWGYTQVWRYSGGIKNWKDSGMDVATGPEPGGPPAG